MICLLVMALAVPLSAALRQGSEGLPKEWLTVRDAYARHDDKARALLKQRAAKAEAEETRRLAALLLEQWAAAPASEVLKHPQLLFMPKQLPEKKVVRLEMFDVRVRVSAQGRVMEASFASPPEQTDLGKIVLRNVRSALFRPAFKDGKFTEAEIHVGYTIEVK